MELLQVSEQLYRVYACVRDSNCWMTTGEIAKNAHVAPRTARKHTADLLSAGLLRQADVFPGPRYAFVKPSDKSRKALAQRIEGAGKVFA